MHDVAVLDPYPAHIAPFFPLGRPQGYYFDNGKKYRLTADFRYVDEEKGIDLTVPAGFITDFNSVPRVMWWWFAPQDCVEAAIVHDFLYAFNRMARTEGAWARGQIDDLWRRVLHITEMRKSKRLVGWLGVRMGGWLPWRKHRAADAGA